MNNLYQTFLEKIDLLYFSSSHQPFWFAFISVTYVPLTCFRLHQSCCSAAEEHEPEFKHINEHDNDNDNDFHIETLKIEWKRSEEVLGGSDSSMA